MNFINKDSWTQEDIQNLIDINAEESVHLEFKSSGSLDQADKKKIEISKDVSAFANSDGGIIIYGLSETNHTASSLDYIDGNRYTKEWLELVISGGIQRPIKDLRIFPIRFENDISKTVYVVVIPLSADAPHMTKDKKFYRRYNFQSVPMEEYEIRNLYYRSKNASLSYNDIEIKFLPAGILNTKKLETEFSVKIKNESSGIATLYKTLLFFKGRDMGIEISADRQKVVCSSLQNGLLLSSILNPPIFPGEIYCSLAFTLSIDLSNLAAINGILSPVISIQYETGSYQQTLSLGHEFYEQIRKAARTRGYILPPKRKIV